ncbi:hypothetical protein [Sphingobacterium sp. UBA6320]|uniref:hypothetical protein n=1 Tax=Sphingobacterium sp. UBA6320 TaxID=1947510 RepID=UPI0025CBCF27|nr:hypothetical protein [Sphingobacterium sp. UBA6320]
MIKKYLGNCFILILPILIWNILLTDHLPPAYQPEVFSKDIPSFLMYGEQISRIIIFLLAFLMPLHISRSNKGQMLGLYIYTVGVLLYFASWIMLIGLPNSAWSNSMVGFSAPAITPALWLAGIGLIGNSFYFNLPFRRWPFMFISAIFLFFHISHTIGVYYTIHS